MRDPDGARSRRSAPTSRPRTPTPRRALADTAGAAGGALRRDEGAHQGGRQLGAGARRRLRVLRQLRHRRPVSAAVPAARAAAAPRRSCSTATRRPRASATGSSGPPPTAPTTAIWPMPSTRRARSSSRSASATWPPARTCARPSRTRAAPSSGARDSQTLFYVRLDANQRPLFVYRHRVGTAGKSDVLVYEEKDKRLLRRRRPDPVGASSSPSRRTTTRRPRST